MNPTNGPIADLSYRSYTGPKGHSGPRWWPIAKNGLRVSLRKKGFWVLAILAGLPSLMLIFMMFLKNIGAGIAPDAFPSFESLLADSYSNSGFWGFLVALLVGTGSIAADNRANALQVYLAKPITKRDYLIGKWMFIFILVAAVYFGPMLVATMYNALSEGFVSFVKQQPFIFFKLAALSAIPAALHASVLIGISAWNKTPWVVGVIYAGLWLFSSFFALILGQITRGGSEKIVATFEHFSINGIIGGIGTNILGAAPRGVGTFMQAKPLPYVAPLFALFIILSLAGVFLASTRIRAVEVVQS